MSRFCRLMVRHLRVLPLRCDGELPRTEHQYWSPGCTGDRSIRLIRCNHLDYPVQDMRPREPWSAQRRCSRGNLSPHRAGRTVAPSRSLTLAGLTHAARTGPSVPTRRARFLRRTFLPPSYPCLPPRSVARYGGTPAGSGNRAGRPQCTVADEALLPEELAVQAAPGDVESPTRMQEGRVGLPQSGQYGMWTSQLEADAVPRVEVSEQLLLTDFADVAGLREAITRIARRHGIDTRWWAADTAALSDRWSGKGLSPAP